LVHTDLPQHHQTIAVSWSTLCIERSLGRQRSLQPQIDERRSDVAALHTTGLAETGIFPDVAKWIDDNIHNIWILGVVSGVLSAVVDTFTIAISDISLYTVVDETRLEQAVDVAYVSQFARNGAYWMIVAYSTAVGGCLLSVGSVSGLALMKMEHVHLGWYLRNMTLKVMAGWIVGLAVLWLELYYV